jgi:hypothetical protein
VSGGTGANHDIRKDFLEFAPESERFVWWDNTAFFHSREDAARNNFTEQCYLSSQPIRSMEPIVGILGCRMTLKGEIGIKFGRGENADEFSIAGMHDCKAEIR